MLRKLAFPADPVRWVSKCSGNSRGWYDSSITMPPDRRTEFLLRRAAIYPLSVGPAIVISMRWGAGVAGLSSNRALRRQADIVELVRRSAAVLILWVFYGLPQLTGARLTVFWAAVFAWRVGHAFQPRYFRGIQR